MRTPRKPMKRERELLRAHLLFLEAYTASQQNRSGDPPRKPVASERVISMDRRQSA